MPLWNNLCELGLGGTEQDCSQYVTQRMELDNRPFMQSPSQYSLMGVPELKNVEGYPHTVGHTVDFGFGAIWHCGYLVVGRHLGLRILKNELQNKTCLRHTVIS